MIHANVHGSGVGGAEVSKCSGEAWTQQAVIDVSEEQGRAEIELGDAIAETARQAIGGGADKRWCRSIRFWITARQSCNMITQIG
jgi:hypothetical protein